MKLLANSSEFDNQLQRGNELDGDVEEIETIKGSAELTTRKNIYSESQEEESSEEDNGLVGGLVKTFLGGLSKVSIKITIQMRNKIFLYFSAI